MGRFSLVIINNCKVAGGKFQEKKGSLRSLEVKIITV